MSKTNTNNSACQEQNPNDFLVKTHQFGISDAEEYGVVGAIILQNIRYHLMLNASNGTCIEEGKYWAYASVKSLLKLMPYIPRRTFYNTLEKLVKDGAIVRKSKFVNKVKVTFFTLGEKLYPKKAIPKQKGQQVKCENGTLVSDKSAKLALSPLYKNNKNKNRGEDTPSNCSSFSLQEIIEYLNYKCERAFKHDSRGTLIAFKWLLTQKDISLDDLKAVVDLKASQWLKNDAMKQNLRPSTLFSQKNFHVYLDEAKEGQTLVAERTGQVDSAIDQLDKLM